MNDLALRLDWSSCSTVTVTVFVCMIPASPDIAVPTRPITPSSRKPRWLEPSPSPSKGLQPASSPFVAALTVVMVNEFWLLCNLDSGTLELAR